MLVNMPEGVTRCSDGTFSVEPVMPIGRVDAELLETVAALVKRFGLPGVRLTAAQRLMIEGIPGHRLNDVIAALGGACGNYPQKISSCRGKGNCKRGVRDTLEMAGRLEEVLNGAGETPAKVKVGISGCPRCCGSSYVRDVGLVATAGGWTLVFGGNAGRRARCGDELLVDASEAEVTAALSHLLAFYAKEGKKRERTARFVERVGIDAVREVLSQI